MHNNKYLETTAFTNPITMKFRKYRAPIDSIPVAFNVVKKIIK